MAGLCFSIATLPRSVLALPLKPSRYWVCEPHAPSTQFEPVQRYRYRRLLPKSRIAATRWSDPAGFVPTTGLITSNEATHSKLKPAAPCAHAPPSEDE